MQYDQLSSLSAAFDSVVNNVFSHFDLSDEITSVNNNLKARTGQTEKNGRTDGRTDV